MENDQIHLQAAYVLYVQKKYEEAYEIIMNHRLYENSYISSEYYRIKGIIEAGLKKYEEAEKSLLKSLCKERNDIYYKIKVEMAHLYFKQRKLNQTADICLEILNNNNKYMEHAMIILGNICQVTDQYEKANKYYLESIKYNCSRDHKGYFYVGNVYMIKKQYEKAKEYYKKYLETASNSKNRSKSYLKLALISAKEGKIDQLENFLNKLEKKI